MLQRVEAEPRVVLGDEWEEAGTEKRGLLSRALMLLTVHDFFSHHAIRRRRFLVDRGVVV
jgi:hypothetical protein